MPAQYTVWEFFTYLLFVKFAMCVCKDDNKLKRRRGWPIFYKKIIAIKSMLSVIARMLFT